MAERPVKMEPIKNWYYEKEKQIIKPFYDSVAEFIEVKKTKPVYRLWFDGGTQIIARYLDSMNDANTVDAMYYGKEKEIPEHLQGKPVEYYYNFIFTVLKMEKQGKQFLWIKEGKNIGFTYHDFPTKFELIKNHC